MIAFLKNLFRKRKKTSRKSTNVWSKEAILGKSKLDTILEELNGIEGIEIKKFRSGEYGMSIDASMTDITPEMIIRMIKRRMEGEDND